MRRFHFIRRNRWLFSVAAILAGAVVLLSLLQPAGLPWRPFIALSALILSLALTAIALIGHRSHQRFDHLATPVEGTWVSGLSILATIPPLEPDPTLADPPANLTPPPAFQSLYTNIRLLALFNHGPVTRILITSVNPGEGKSFIAANLAAVIAQAGHRILLIDAHPRQPVQHGRFHLHREPGLADLLQILGEDDRPDKPAADLSPYIQPTAVVGLDLLAAGSPTPGDWTGCLPAFHKLINELTGPYEYLVLDGPPLLEGTLAASLNELVNGMFLVIDTALTRRAQLSTALSPYALKAKCSVILNRIAGPQSATVTSTIGQSDDTQYTAAVRPPSHPSFERPPQIEEIEQPPAPRALNGTLTPPPHPVEEIAATVVAGTGPPPDQTAVKAAVQVEQPSPSLLHEPLPQEPLPQETAGRLEALTQTLTAAREQITADKSTIEQLRSERDKAWRQLEDAVQVRRERDQLQQQLSAAEQSLSELTEAFEQLWQQSAAFQEQILWQEATQKALYHDLTQARQSAAALAARLEQNLAEQQETEAWHYRERQTQLDLAHQYQAIIAELKQKLQAQEENLAASAEQMAQLQHELAEGERQLAQSGLQMQFELAERDRQLAQSRQQYQEADLRYQDALAGLTSQLAAARNALTNQTTLVATLRADLKNKTRIIVACERKSGDLTRLLVDAGRKVEQSSSAARQEMVEKAKLWKLAAEQIRRLEEELARARQPLVFPPADSKESD